MRAYEPAHPFAVIITSMTAMLGAVTIILTISEVAVLAEWPTQQSDLVGLVGTLTVGVTSWWALATAVAIYGPAIRHVPGLTQERTVQNAQSLLWLVPAAGIYMGGYSTQPAVEMATALTLAFGLVAVLGIVQVQEAIQRALDRVVARLGEAT